MTVRLNRGAIKALLNGAETRAAVSKAAATVGSLAKVTAHDGPARIVVEDYTTDRAASGVTIAHPAGIALEAKHGTLSMAATAAGLEMNARRIR
ncbi:MULTISPECIES: hypothetical protein [Bacteria]|uniref:hypothetical protein n=1 Tax=Bacteria TaxID=2 RepID=UPI003C7DA97E